ncbi:MAG: Lrp/AsnC family transcriptional regulator [Desulfobacterales bacterium]|nr:Lrp/AsnC family transcriptional regulator [Desulfobacterales bacterium]
MYSLDDTDKQILNKIQSNFPTDAKPFSKIASDLNLPSDLVIKKIERMKENNIIRRIGGNFSPDKIGYKSTLCAAKVPKKDVESFAKIVNSYSGVTHNYVREHDYNIWFTFIAKSRETIEKNLKEISTKTGIKKILNLPATDLFKISAQFKV